MMSASGPVTVADATGAEPARARALTEVLIGTVQGTELNRALAGLNVDHRRLERLREHALSVLPG